MEDGGEQAHKLLEALGEEVRGEDEAALAARRTSPGRGQARRHFGVAAAVSGPSHGSPGPVVRVGVATTPGLSPEKRPPL